MSYTDLITKEEILTLCDIITGKEFKEQFKRNEPEFSKIRKGFRAKSLTEQLALSIAKANIDKPFISLVVNTKVESWLMEIQENIISLESGGLSHIDALASTMLDSVFVDHVDLYLKLTGKSIEEDDYSKLCFRMEHIKAERAKSIEIADHVKAIEEENQRLSIQLEEAKRMVEAVKADCQQEIREIEHSKEELASSLAEAQDKIIELQTTPLTIESDDENLIALYDDTNESALPLMGSDESVCLCEVSTDYSGRKCLIRYADLCHDGWYQVYRKSDDYPFNFASWDKIFYKDGPTNDGFYGIWTWSAIPNDKNPSKDYILAQYNTTIDAIEIVMFTGIVNLNELVSLMKEGVKYVPRSRKVMFAIQISHGEYIGILCNSKELNIVGKKASISENCIRVPVYKFKDDDILRLSNGLTFFKDAFAGLPSKLYNLKSPLDIVKKIVFSSISWAAYKTRGFSRAEYRTFKDFISAIPVNDIIGEIEVKCNCSNLAAKELLNQFISMAGKYIDGNSLEDDIIQSAMSANTELREKAKALIREDWEIENKSQLSKAQGKLDAIYVEIKSATDRLTDVQNKLTKSQSEAKRLSDIIAEKERLADDVEKSVAEKIQKARENAADFIANMAFVGGQQVQSASTAVSAQMVDSIYNTHPAFENINELEAHHSWADVINTAMYELGEAGVAEPHRSGLAALLCAAYIERQPILLIGPNSLDIIQAFCASVNAHKYGVLCCKGDYSSEAITQIGNNGEDIVVVNDFLASSWINRLPEILSQKDIFYMLTHPYAEDIQVEPKSLNGFMLPLFTEFFVDKKATGKYYGGYFADDFKAYSEPKGSCKELKAISKLALNSLVRNQITKLVATMHDIYPDTTFDDEFLFAILPIAYASREMNNLTKAMADSQQGITISSNLKRNLQYVLGDV